MNLDDAITNTATLTADNLADRTNSDTVIASAGLPVRPRVDKDPDSADDPSGPSLSPGSEFDFSLIVRNSSVAGGPDLINPTLLDTLPASLELVSYSVAYLSGVTPPGAGDEPVFSQYPDPAGSGTVLRWVWPNLGIPRGTTVRVDLTVRALGGETGVPGPYTNLAMLSGLDNANVQTNRCRQTDQDSDDLDGDTDEILCISRDAPFSILATVGLDSVKEVLGSCPGGGGYGPSAETFGNGPLDYRLTVSNPGNVSVDSALFYDIYPYVGDTGVISTDPRGSEWTPVLTGAVDVPPGASVEYSQSTNPCRPELFGGSEGDPLPSGCTDDWTTGSPADITLVRALRIDFGAITIAPEDTLSFSWPMRAPLSAQIGEVGNNSFGYIASRTDGGSPDLEPAEPNLVITTVDCIEAPPFVGDYVWLDANKDGVQDPSEVGKNGVVVELFDPGSDGVPVGGDDTLVDATVTAPDGNGTHGFYRFGDLLPGSYYVKFTAPAGFSISPRDGTTDTEKDSDPDPLTGIAPVLSLVLGDERLDIDMGLFPATTATVGNYVWIDRDGDGIQNESPSDGLNGVPVRLRDSGGGEIAATVTTDDSFGNSGRYLFRDVPPGTYSIEVDRSDTFATGFTTPNAGTGADDSRIDSDLGGVGEGPQFIVAAGDVVLNQDADVVFPVGAMSLGDRLWLDLNNDGIYEPSTEPGIDGVEVALYEDSDANQVYTPGVDQFVAAASTFTKSGFPGFYEFTELPEGGYLVLVAAENFAAGGPLEFLIPSTGSGSPPPDPDNDFDDDIDQNGDTDAFGNVVTKVITLDADDEPDGDHNPTLDLAFIVLEDTLVAIGNIVFGDDDNDGKFEPGDGELGIDGVAVELYDGSGAFVDSTTTAGGGFYLFDELQEGEYFVHIPASEFQTGGSLEGMISSTGQGGDDENDDDVDENGSDEPNPATNGVSSNLFDLQVGGEPQNESGAGGGDYSGVLPDNNVNLTADLGFTALLSQCDLLCDYNDDGTGDIDDIRAIFYARGQAVPVGSPGDSVPDGILSINDGRECVLLCL